MKSMQVRIENIKTFLNKVFFIENRAAAKTVGKVAHIFPKVPHRVCIISICSIQILLSILRSLTQSCVQQHHMKTQFSKPWMSVGVYASISLKSMVTLKYGTASASWVNTIMDSKETVTPEPHGVLFSCILRESNESLPND